jgi:hypothetical protein
MKWKPLYRQVAERRLMTIKRILDGQRYLPNEVFPPAISDTRCSARIHSQRNIHKFQLAAVNEGKNALHEKLAGAQMRRLWNSLDENVAAAKLAEYRLAIKEDAIFKTLCEREAVLTVNNV